MILARDAIKRRGHLSIAYAFILPISGSDQGAKKTARGRRFP